MASRNWIDESLRDPEIRLSYEVEGLCLEFAEALHEAFEGRGLSQREVARRAGMTASAVSRNLAGEQNMTLETLAKLAFAAGLRVRPEFAEIHEGCPYRVEVSVGDRAAVGVDYPDSPVYCDDDQPLAA